MRAEPGCVVATKFGEQPDYGKLLDTSLLARQQPAQNLERFATTQRRAR